LILEKEYIIFFVLFFRLQTGRGRGNLWGKWGKSRNSTDLFGKTAEKPPESKTMGEMVRDNGGNDCGKLGRKFSRGALDMIMAGQKKYKK
jgi:hypothetical protein